MTFELSGRAGAAMRWRTAQLAGIQAIYFLRLLVLARLLAPDAFGLLAIAAVALSVMLTLSDLGMIPALVQRRDATLEQHNAAWTVGLLRAVFIAAVLSIAAPAVAHLFGEPRAAPIIQALALRPVIEAAASIGVARLTRELRFRELALMYLPGAVIDLVVAIALAPWLGVWALVAGSLAGAVTTALLSYVFAPHRPQVVFSTQLIAPFVRFGRWVMLTGILGLVGTTVLQLVVSRQLGAGALGLYFLASKVALLPLGAASAVVGSVAFPLFADLRDDGTRTAAAFRTLLTGQMILLLPVYGTLIVLAPALETALGPRWIGTAPVMQILGAGAVAALFGETLGPLFMGKGQSARTFALEVVQTGLLLAALWPLVRALGVGGAATAWLAGTVAALLLAFVWFRRILPGERVAEWTTLLAAAVAALAGAAVAALAAAALPNLPGLVVGAASGLVVATALLVVLDRLLGLELSRLVRVMRGSAGSSEGQQSAGAARATDDVVARRSAKG